MTSAQKICLGGVGALTPIVLNLYIVDLEAVWLKATVLAVVGYFLRVITLFYLGGLVAWLHKREENRIKLFELGMAAPALITALLNGTASRPGRVAFHEFVVAPAYAGVISPGDSAYSLKSVPPAESYRTQFLRGLIGGSPPTGGDLPPSTTVYSAAAPGTSAFTAPGGGGIFTKAILRGLSGQADLDGDGTVSLAEMGAYLQRSIPQLTEHRQIPLMETNSDVFGTGLVGSRTILRKARVLAIGIDSYRDRGLAPLPSVQRDAMAFADLVKQQGAQVTLLLGPEATRKNILEAFRSVERSIERDEAFVFYFAGQSVSGNKGFARLAAFDSMLDDQTTMLGFDELKAILNTLPSRQNVVFLDACYGGLGGPPAR